MGQHPSSSNLESDLLASQVEAPASLAFTDNVFSSQLDQSSFA